MSAMKILVVDDERAVRESLRRALELEGYDVDLAGDGLEGLARVEESQPDVLILDVLMPGMDGLEMCRRLRRGGNRLPVLMLTARDAVENRVAGLDAGADDYVLKPFALEELLARVRALLRRTTSGSGEVLRFADLELDPGPRCPRRRVGRRARRRARVRDRLRDRARPGAGVGRRPAQTPCSDDLAAP